MSATPIMVLYDEATGQIATTSGHARREAIEQVVRDGGDGAQLRWVATDQRGVLLTMVYKNEGGDVNLYLEREETFRW